MAMKVTERKIREIECKFDALFSEVRSINNYVECLCSPVIEQVTVFVSVNSEFMVAGTIADKRYYIGLREFICLAEEYDGMKGEMLVNNARFVKNA